MDELINEPLDLTGVPQLRDEPFVGVDPNHLRVSLLGEGLFGAAVLVIGGLAAVAAGDAAWIPLLVAGILVALTLLDMALTVVEFRHLAYQVRQHDVSYRSGVLVRQVSTVPFVRVQHARLRQGPIQRRFGLATVEINSAGPDLRIKGLGSDDAERLRALVVERAGDLDEEA